MSKIFRILYTINVVIIVLILLSPIVKLITDHSSVAVLSIGYYAVLLLLSVTFCVSFLGLNIYGALKYKMKRARYYTISIFISIWILWGIYQIVNGYLNDIAL